LARRFRWLLLPLALAGGVYLFPGLFLRPLGTHLVRFDPPVKSDCLLALAGDANGQRIMKAGDLYREGYAKRVFVSGAGYTYGVSEDQLAIPFARSKGYTDVPFVGMLNRGRSTVTEVRDVKPKLQAAGCGSVLVITSDFHTRRTGNILAREWGTALPHRVTAAPSYDYDAERWWTDRNYQKTFFFEWTKTVADWIGL
jgi:uncharacterized SAM-binding protein YcdF (DUF218 family)